MADIGQIIGSISGAVSDVARVVFPPSNTGFVGPSAPATRSAPSAGGFGLSDVELPTLLLLGGALLLLSKR